MLLVIKGAKILN